MVVPGHGTAARTPTLLRSIGTLRSNTPANVNFSCAIYVYNTSLTVYPKGSVPHRDRCKVFVRPNNLWTGFMRMESGTSTHVILMMDDVYPLNIDLSTMLLAMEQHRIDVFSPSVFPRWNWVNMNQGSAGDLVKRTYAPAASRPHGLWAMVPPRSLPHRG